MAKASGKPLVLALSLILAQGLLDKAYVQTETRLAIAAVHSSKRSGWPVPSCAWKRSVGDIPKTDQLYKDVLNTPMRSKKGIPLGGIGAGNFMYNFSGSFGPWHMKPGRYEERFLPQAAFHVREAVKGKDAKVRTLATEDVLPAWTRLHPGDGDYFALFPRGWITYNVFDTDISLQFFSPIIKDNYKETSLPAALFLFKIHNPLRAPAKVSIMFTFPNAPYTGPQGLRENATLGVPALEKSRRGLSNVLVRDAKNGITAVLMRAKDPSNPPETENSEWCVAARGRASYVTNWDGGGDGSDIWKAFERDGTLGNNVLNPGNKYPSGAVCLLADVPPNSEVILPFALTWYFPQVEFGEGTRWWRRYTEFFPPREGQAFDIAKQALLNQSTWLDAIESWTRPITDNPAYPDWLKQGALNELYYATFGGSFWENGCITKPKKFGNRPGQHLEFVMECQEYRFAETLDVRHHAAHCYRDLWPAIERDVLLGFADFIMDTPDGSPPHDAGSPDQDPLFKYDAYASEYNTTERGIPGRVTTPWSEFSPKFIQQVHAYWFKTKDQRFLDEVWPAVVRTFRYQKTTDLDHDGITEMKSSEYKDNKLFNAVLWIGALEALKAMAEFRNDKAVLEEVRNELELARASAEKQFWNPDLGYYQYNARNTDIMGDAMLGERYVDLTGLPPVLDTARITSHYRQLFRRAVLPLRDLDGDGIGDVGVANALRSDSTPGIGDSEFNHQFEVWTGVSYNAAANLYHWGKKIHDGALQAEGLFIGWSVYHQTWMNDRTAYWFSTPEAWRIDDPAQFRALMYQRARAIWELLTEVRDPYK